MVPARHLYRLLLEVHPLEFRCRFATEMLWIFDELPESNRPALMLDGIVSLLRQWLLRSGLWKFVLGLAVNIAIVSFCIIATDLSGPGAGQRGTVSTPVAAIERHP